jgi:hypothetical protein
MQHRPFGRHLQEQCRHVQMQLGPCSVDTSRSSTFLCRADTSRYSLCPAVDTSRSSTILCSADTSKNIKGKCQRLSKRSEISDNDVFFDIEAKRTHSIVGKFISKRSEHVYIKDFKYRSEAKQVNIKM